MRRYAGLVAVLALVGAGCNQNRDQLATALAQAQAAEAEKDSLLTEVLETTQFVSDINAELARAKGGTAGGAGSDRGIPGAKQDRAERQVALTRVKQVIARLDESEARLAQTEARARQARQRDARLLAQIDTYKRTITDLKTTAQEQKAQYEAIIVEKDNQIALLASRVDTLGTENTRLSADKSALADTIGKLTTSQNRVYYAAGTRDELMKKGVIVKEGSKFLVFGGTRLEPARKLNTDAFVPLDKTRDLSITLPRSDKNYKIVSRQSPSYLATHVRKDGKIRGSVEIARPDEFWSPSKYLILVQD